ncbi:hypothetical protein [Haloplanus halobius]|uniref:hypothetical protein n=1 Tax=Haloplanus halobius TaxID=2934938 RepID=UPI00200FC172|nr:hypothetical protein [Haloplanus sp. XH21]
MVAPPAVPSERLTDWRQASDGTETPFSAAGVTVTAHVLVCEDDTLREAIERRTGVDRSWRFFLAPVSNSPPRHPSPTRSGDRIDPSGFRSALLALIRQTR